MEDHIDPVKSVLIVERLSRYGFKNCRFQTYFASNYENNPQIYVKCEHTDNIYIPEKIAQEITLKFINVDQELKDLKAKNFNFMNYPLTLNGILQIQKMLLQKKGLQTYHDLTELLLLLLVTLAEQGEGAGILPSLVQPGHFARDEAQGGVI